MKFDDNKIKNVGELISFLKKDLAEFEGPVWFRGQSDKDWKLEPKLLRSNPILPESHLLNRFKQNASFMLDRLPR